MCTLIVITQHPATRPLVVAANRDERLTRPATGPELWAKRPIALLAPRDVQAGGTWLGLNARGVFAAITNRFGMTSAPHHRSRGLLVLDALEASDAGTAAERIGGYAPTDYNGFHLVVADPTGAWLVWNDGATIHRQALAPGIHVFSERSLADHESHRTRWLEGRLHELDRAGRLDEASLTGLLSTHHESGIEGVCVHVDGMDYGTRSSTYVELGHDGRPARLLHADGPPCRVAYRDYREAAAGLVG